MFVKIGQVESIFKCNILTIDNVLKLKFESKNMFNTNYISNVMHFNATWNKNYMPVYKDLDTLHNNEK